MRSLAAFMRAVTKQTALPLLSSVADDKLKMAKIEENYEQFVAEYPFDDGKKKVETASASAAGFSSSSSTAPQQQITNEPAVVDSKLYFICLLLPVV